MIDQIYDRDGEDVPLDVSMIMALGLENGTRVTNDIIKHNPSWTSETTRFEIWDDIANLAYSKGLFIHPDLHIGKAQWCCSHEDENSWFDDARESMQFIVVLSEPSCLQCQQSLVRRIGFGRWSTSPFGPNHIPISSPCRSAMSCVSLGLTMV